MNLGKGNSSDNDQLSTLDNCNCKNKVLNLSSGRFHNYLSSIDSENSCNCFTKLDLEHNQIDFFPLNFKNYSSLTYVNISNNYFKGLPLELCAITTLKCIVAKCNFISDDEISDKFLMLSQLEKLDLSGNKCKTIPGPILEMVSLKELDFGANEIIGISSSIKYLKNLEYLYLGGNKIIEVPDTLGSLTRLRVLSLADNRISYIPPILGRLHRLESLSLHGNNLHALPPAIVKLKRLKELSLRNNPLVRHFVQKMDWDVPSMMELAGRTIINYRSTLLCGVDLNEQLPTSLMHYLSSSQQCANPHCSGVYFSSCVEHVKFKDFCGKYRMPLLAFLCSPGCQDYSISTAYNRASSSASSSSDDADDEESYSRVRKVLLG